MGRAELPTESNSFARKVAFYTSDAGSPQSELGSVSHTSRRLFRFIFYHFFLLSKVFQIGVDLGFYVGFPNVVQQIGVVISQICVLVLSSVRNDWCFVSSSQHSSTQGRWSPSCFQLLPRVLGPPPLKTGSFPGFLFVQVVPFLAMNSH